MKKKTAKKLGVKTETVRKLAAAKLDQAEGGAIVQTKTQDTMACIGGEFNFHYIKY